MAEGAASAKVAAGAGQEKIPAEVAAGAPSVEVAADADPAEYQDPRGRWLAEYGSAPTDPEAPPIRLNTTMSDQPDTISVGRADARNLMSRLRRRELHRLVQRELRAWTRRLRTWTWPGCVA